MTHNPSNERATEMARSPRPPSVNQKGTTMKYMLMICDDESIEVRPEEESAEPWVEEMDRRGVRLSGSALHPTSAATTVRVRDGEQLITDGPFAESKEAMVGYDLIECADFDEAIEVASKHPIAKYGAVEIRPLREE